MRGLPLLIALTAGFGMTLRIPAQIAEGGSFSLAGQWVGAGGFAQGVSFQWAGVLEPVTADISIGGDWILAGGLFDGVQRTARVVELFIDRLPDGTVRLRWTEGLVGFQLQSTPNLADVGLWNPVLPAPVGNSLVVPVDNTPRYFRLLGP